MALVERRDVDGIAILSLNRPEALNALNPALFIELREHVDAIAEQTETVGCVILRAEGRSFSAGNDLKSIQAGERPPSKYFQADTVSAIEALPQPVIVAAQGHCYTGALELALACDLLIAAESAKFADTHGRWGMVPTWGMTQRLPRRIGELAAKELMFSGRVVSGAEAVELRLANRCVPDDQLDDAALEMARSFVANSWHTLRGEKQLIRAGMGRTLPDALSYERENYPGRAPDYEERVASFGKS